MVAYSTIQFKCPQKIENEVRILSQRHFEARFEVN